MAKSGEEHLLEKPLTENFIFCAVNTVTYIGNSSLTLFAYLPLYFKGHVLGITIGLFFAVFLAPILLG